MELPANHASSREAGSAYLTATIEGSGETSVWVVRLGDRDRFYADRSVSCDGGGFEQQPRDNTGNTFAMLNLIGEIRIPIGRGTLPVHISRTDSVIGVTYMVDATVTATVSKK